MPLPIIAAALAVLAVALRYIVLAAVQLGLWSLIEKYGLPLLRKAVEEIAQATGTTEEEAKDLAANELLTAFAGVGLFAVSLRSKLPLKVADYLGFTSKGWSKRKLTSKLEAAVGGQTINTATKAVATTAELEKVAATVAATRGLSLTKVKDVVTLMATIVGVPTAFFFMIAQYIDFANWQGPYQKQFQKFLALFGLKTDTPLPSSKSISSDAWQKIYTIVEEMNPQTIAFPWRDEVRPYSRQNLADAVDHFAANLAAQEISPTYKTVWALLLPCIGIKPGGTSTSAAASLPAAGAGVSTYAPVKVFTGVLTNGVLGSTQPFSAREDDLINSAEELRDVAQTNAAAFIASLPGKIVYELKIVNSVIASDGTKRIGASVRVPNGTLKSGAIKYKYVTNKFAVMSLYFIKREGTRTKIADITLGPTDVAQFNPAGTELAGIGRNLVQTVSTNNTNDISTIISDTPTATEMREDVIQPLPNYNLQPKQPGDLGYAFYVRPAFDSNPPSYLAIPDYKFYDTTYNRISEEEYRRATGDTRDYTNSGYYLKDGVFTQATTYRPSHLVATSAPPTTTATTGSAGVAAKATNLSQYYAALGQSLPSLSSRGQTYQSLGLGAASLYTGTVEQNTKLLIALQAN